MPKPEQRTPLLVVAALILHAGKLLICQRRRKDSFPLKWEFPGGKVHAGEGLKAALARELREELGVESSVGREVYRTRHRYQEHPREVELAFYLATLTRPEAIQNLAFESLLWADPADLPAYDFLSADHELVTLLASGKLKLDE